MSVRAAVVGVGHLGRHHARIYSELEGVELVAIVDHDQERAHKLAGQFGGQVFGSHEALADLELDCVSVAVPTVHHYEVASWFLKRHVAALVEKPITPTVEQARKLTALAKETGACLQVGHVERFHPALRATRSLELEPRFIEAHRLAPFSFRSTDVGVVLDLMIHDLDLVLHLVRAPIVAVHANGGSVLSAAEDIASARIEFEGGAVANLTASRVSLNRMRRMRVFSPRFFLTLDFDKKAAFLARKTGDFDDKFDAVRDMLSTTSPDQMGLVAATAFRDLVEIENLPLDEAEPLKAEIASFVDSVRSGTPPEVPGEEALRALEAAEMVLEKIRAQPW